MRTTRNCSSAVVIDFRTGNDVSDGFMNSAFATEKSRIFFPQSSVRQTAGFRRAFDRDLIADRVGANAEPALDLGKVLVIKPEEQRGVAIVIESQGDFGRRVGGDRRLLCAQG